MAVVEKTVDGVMLMVDSDFEALGGVNHGFTTRVGGVSQGIFQGLNIGASRGDDKEHVCENYRQLFSAIGASDSQMVATNQVHKNVVRRVEVVDIKTGPYQGVDFEADGLVTDIPGVTLVVFGADCLPILFYDPVKKVIAGVHAGWRGTAQNIVGEAIKGMKGFGCQPKDIRVSIGAGISKCCFETHGDVPEGMEELLGKNVWQFIETLGNGKYLVDIKSINGWLVEMAGVQKEHISICEECTACKPNKYWSHRVTKGERGSQGACIRLT